MITIIGSRGEAILIFCVNCLTDLQRLLRGLKFPAAAFCSAAETKESNGWTPFLSAALRSVVETVQLLIDSGSDIRAVDRESRDAYALAIKFDKPEAAKVVQRQLGRLLSNTSIPRHFSGNLIDPRGDATFDTLAVFETSLPQDVRRKKRIPN